MKKHRKIKETEGHIKKNQEKIAKLQEESRKYYLKIGGLAQKIRQTSKEVEPSVAREIFLDA